MRYFTSSLTAVLTILPSLVLAVTSRTTAPAGALIVRKTGAGSGEFSTIQAAVDAAGTGTNAVTIFIFAGVYAEQVFVSRPGPVKMMGVTTDVSDFTKNQVTITAGATITSAGSDDLSGTLRVHKDNFALYSINVVNSHGKGVQAIALSAYGSKQGYYASQFRGYQDTVLAESGTQYYGHSLIQGAVDFFWGQTSQAYIKTSTINSVGPGAIAASGRASNDAGIYVFDGCTLELDASAPSGTSGAVFLGRPWRPFARVKFQGSTLGGHIAAAGWEEWNGSTDTANVQFIEANNNGAGASTAKRIGFAKTETTSTTISSVLGPDYTSWVDSAFL